MYFQKGDPSRCRQVHGAARVATMYQSQSPERRWDARGWSYATLLNGQARALTPIRGKMLSYTYSTVYRPEGGVREGVIRALINDVARAATPHYKVLEDVVV